MAKICPRCRAPLENPKGFVCPNCGYPLRLPVVGKAGALLLLGGLLAYVVALFAPEEIWTDVLLVGVIVTVIGLAALVVAGLTVGRARRA
ncbi:MAG: hypothetical protein ACE5EW_03195 [Thermoplasmata archaeon]